jgi:hypothetical protein
VRVLTVVPAVPVAPVVRRVTPPAALAVTVAQRATALPVPQRPSLLLPLVTVVPVARVAPAVPVAP